MFPFDLAVGQWGQAPATGNYRLQDVAPTFNAGDGAGISGVIDSNSGAAWDSLRKEMLWYAAGGHNLLAWNGGFAYCTDPSSPHFLQFRRKFNPSPRSDGLSVIQYADGSPSAAHRYWNTVYVPWLDRVYNFPGGARWGTSASQQQELWSVDCKRETPNATAPTAWTRHTDPASFPPSDPTIAPIVCIDPVRKRIIQQNSRGVCTYNTATDSYVNQTDFAYLYSVFGASPAYIPGLDLFVFYGGGYDQAIKASDFSAVGAAQHNWGLTGDLAARDIEGPGLDYCNIDGNMYAWGGLLTGGTNRGDVYRINPNTKVATRINGGATQPSAPNAGYTYGRFRHIGDGVFMLVNSHSEAPWFYRAVASQGKEVPDTVFTPTLLTGTFQTVADISAPTGGQFVCADLNGINWAADSAIDFNVQVAGDGVTFKDASGGRNLTKAQNVGNKSFSGSLLTGNVPGRRVRVQARMASGTAVTLSGCVVMRKPDKVI